jgi:hypothetical protein
MTDQRPSDELISAHLDGEATPEEGRAVDASAAARARRDELDAVRALVGRPVVPPPGARDDAVAAALAVHDREIAGSPGTVTSLPGRRARRRPRLAPVLGAAASIAVILGAGFVAVRLADRPEYGVNAAGEATQAASAPARGASPNPPPMSGGGQESPDEATAYAKTDRPYVGVITDAPSLRRAVTERLQSQATARLAEPTNEDAGASDPVPRAASPEVDPMRCDAQQRAADSSLGALVLAASATYDGRPASVLVYQANPTAPWRAFLLDQGSCRVLLVDPG